MFQQFIIYNMKTLCTCFGKIMYTQDIPRYICWCKYSYIDNICD